MNLADVTVHIDELLTEDKLDQMEHRLRDLNGVISVGGREAGPHLVIVEFDPDKLHTSNILHCVEGLGVHAELIGL